MSRRTLNADRQTDPGSNIVAVTKSDATNDPNGPFRGICFGTAGIVKVTTLDGSDVAIPSGVLAAGVIHPLYILRVWSTTTTATDIYGVV